MAECHLNELGNKTEAEIFALLDKKNRRTQRDIRRQICDG
jgi:hypothetical protein